MLAVLHVHHRQSRGLIDDDEVIAERQHQTHRSTEGVPVTNLRLCTGLPDDQLSPQHRENMPPNGLFTGGIPCSGFPKSPLHSLSIHHDHPIPPGLSHD
jgi:hypothetical protein